MLRQLQAKITGRPKANYKNEAYKRKQFFLAT